MLRTCALEPGLRRRELALARQAVTHKVQAAAEAVVIDAAVDVALLMASTARSNQGCAAANWSWLDRLAIAVAMDETIGRTSAVWGTGEALDIELHQTLRSEADHLAQEVSVGGLLQQATEVHGVFGHRWVLGWR
jgi:hypothetical protein